MTISDHLPLDPFPGFSTCSLDFPLDNLANLYDFQLALVQFHPRATEENKVEAQVVFWRRRIARDNRDEDGKVELDAALRQLKRAREWLEGKVPGSRPMRDASAQTTARVVSRSQARLLAAAPNQAARDSSAGSKSPPAAPPTSRSAPSPPRVHPSSVSVPASGSAAPAEGPPSRPAAAAPPLPLPPTTGAYPLAAPAVPSTAGSPAVVPAARAITAPGLPRTQAGPASSRPEPSPANRSSIALTLPRKSAAATASPDVDASSTSPATSTAPRNGSGSSSSADVCPPELLSQLHTLWVSGFDQSVTPALFLAWLKRRGKESQPAPMAITQFSSSTYVVAYGHPSDVRVAQRQIDGQSLPRRKCKLRAVSGSGAASSRIKWSDLMPEVQERWTRTGRLPPPQALPMAPHGSGALNSAEYQAELDRIDRAALQSGRIPAPVSDPRPSRREAASAQTRRPASTSSNAAAATAPVGQPPAAVTSTGQAERSSIAATLALPARPSPVQSASAHRSSTSAVVSGLAPNRSTAIATHASLPQKPIPRPGPQITLPERPKAATGAASALPVAAASHVAPAPLAPSTTSPPALSMNPPATHPTALPSASSSANHAQNLPAATPALPATDPSRPIESSPSSYSQSAYDDGHSPDCPCCPPRPADLHAWTPHRLSTVLLAERNKSGDAAFERLAHSFRAYIQAYGCEELRIRASCMPWYRRRDPPPPPSSQASSAATGSAASVGRSRAPSDTSARKRPEIPAVSTDPRKRPRVS